MAARYHVYVRTGKAHFVGIGNNVSMLRSTSFSEEMPAVRSNHLSHLYFHNDSPGRGPFRGVRGGASCLIPCLDGRVRGPARAGKPGHGRALRSTMQASSGSRAYSEACPPRQLYRRPASRLRFQPSRHPRQPCSTSSKYPPTPPFDLVRHAGCTGVCNVGPSSRLSGCSMPDDPVVFDQTLVSKRGCLLFRRDAGLRQ